MTTLVEFGEWLKSQLDSRKMKAIDLSRVSGVDKGIISRTIRGERMPRPESLVAMAKGLEIPPARIFEAAGYFPHPPQETQEIEELEYLFEGLTPRLRKEMLRWIRFNSKEEEPTKKQPSRITRNPARNVLIEK